MNDDAENAARRRSVASDESWAARQEFKRNRALRLVPISMGLDMAGIFHGLGMIPTAAEFDHGHSPTERSGVVSFCSSGESLHPPGLIAALRRFLMKVYDHFHVPKFFAYRRDSQHVISKKAASSFDYLSKDLGTNENPIAIKILVDTYGGGRIEIFARSNRALPTDWDDTFDEPRRRIVTEPIVSRRACRRHGGRDRD